MGIELVIVNRLVAKYIKLLPKFKECIVNSFLSQELKQKYTDLLEKRLARLK